jgi:hypothetical protein
MNSFIKTLFLDIQNRIVSEVPEIVFIDQNIGQYGFEDFRAKLSFPAVLIDFPNIAYSAMQGNIQLGIATINISLIFDTYSQTYNIAPEEVKELGLKYLDIEQKIYQSLQGWSNDTCTPLVRTDTKSENRNEIGLRIRDLNFTCEFEDWSLEDEKTKDVVFSFTGALK